MNPIQRAESRQRSSPLLPASLTMEKWPSPLHPDAYFGLAGEIVRGIEPTTEADPAALLLQLLTLFGNAVGRGPNVRVEETPHFTNEFLVLVGPTGSGRKGTSFDRILHCFPESSWRNQRIRSGLSSGEGLLWCVRDPGKRPGKRGTNMPEVDHGELDKRLLIQEPEFSGVLRMNERQGNTISAILRQLWEGKESIHTLTKNDPTQATKAHVSVIGHITAEDLHRYLTVNEVANGFANRFLYVATRRSKLLPEGGQLDPHMAAAFREQLANVIEQSVTVEALKRDPAATTLWHAVYPLLTAERGGLVGQLSARAAPHVVRLSLLYALLDQASAIGVDHLLAALAVWDYVERSILAIFGSASANPALAKVAQLLEEAPEGLTRTELMNALQRHVPANRLTDHLQQLLQHRLARSESTPTRGRPAERWLACEPSQAMTATLECALTTLGRSIAEHRPVSIPIRRWPSP